MMCFQGHRATSWHVVEIEELNEVEFFRITSCKSYWVHTIIWGSKLESYDQGAAIRAAIAELRELWEVTRLTSSVPDQDQTVEKSAVFHKPDSSDDDTPMKKRKCASSSSHDDDASGNTPSKRVRTRSNQMQTRLRRSMTHPVKNVTMSIGKSNVCFAVKPTRTRNSIMIEATSASMNAFVRLVQNASKALSPTSLVHVGADPQNESYDPADLLDVMDSDRIKWNKSKVSWQVSYKNADDKVKRVSSAFKVDISKTRTKSDLVKVSG